MQTLPGQIIEGLLWFLLLFLWIRLVFDWVQMFARRWYPTGWTVVILELTYSVTDPPVKAMRRLIPPLRMGGMSIDIAFFLVLILVYLAMTINRRVLLY